MAKASTGARRQAQTEGKVRYAPQQRLLKQLLQDVQAQFKSGLAGENSAYQALVDSARGGRPEMSSAFRDAASVAHNALTPAAGAPDFNAMGLGAGAAPFLAAAARDSGATQGRLAQQLQDSLGSLTDREQQAAAGRAFGVGKLATDTAQQATKIRGQMSGLSSDESAFVAQRLGELLKAQGDRSFTAGQKNKDRTNAQITAGVNPDGTVIKGGPKDPAVKRAGSGKGAGNGGATPWLPSKSQHDAMATMDRAEQQVRKLIRSGKTPEQAAQVLADGRDKIEGYPSTYSQVAGSTVDPQTGVVMKGGKPVVYPGTTKVVKVDKITLPAIAAVDPVYVQAALDRVKYNGRLRKATVNALHDSGVKVGKQHRTVSPADRRAADRKRQGERTMAGVFPGVNFTG